MALGNYKVGYLIKNISRYSDFNAVDRWYHENPTKHFLKHFVFDRPAFEQGAYFPKTMFIYKIKGNSNITNQDVQKDAYLSDFLSKQLVHHIGKFAFSLPNSSTLKNLLAPKDNF